MGSYQKADGITLSQLNNTEYTNFMNRVLTLLTAGSISKLTVTNIVNSIKPKLVQMEDLVNRSTANAETKDLLKLDAERDSGDYVNVRVSGGANGLIQIHRGMRLRVHGFIQSRDFKESLEEFLEKALKQSNNEFQVEATGLKPNQVQIDRNAIEIVARRLIVMDNGNNTEKKPKPSLTAE